MHRIEVRNPWLLERDSHEILNMNFPSGSTYYFEPSLHLFLFRNRRWIILSDLGLSSYSGFRIRESRFPRFRET